MARRRQKASLHSAGRVTETELLQRAAALRDDPSLAIPVCEGKCIFFSPIPPARKGIMKAHAARDDEKTLQKLASSGNDLSRAYAATLLVALAGKIPVVADLRLPDGPVPYVIRGAAKPFYLAGLQHHDDRILRLLAVTGWVKKRGLHFYSANRGVICTGRADAPPQDFVLEEVTSIGLTKRDDGVFACPHAHERDAVHLTWRNANVQLARCLECSAGTSTLHAIVRHIAAPGVTKAFDINARLVPLRNQAGAPPDESFTLPTATVAEYRSGRLTDKGLVEAARAARVVALRRAPHVVYVGGDVSYGDDKEVFLKALNPTETEAKVLRAALAAHAGPIVLDKASSARALAELWPEHGRLMLEAAGASEEIVNKLYVEAPSAEQAAEVVRKAGRAGAESAVLHLLPKYGRLPPAAETGHLVTRAFRAEGKAAAVRVALERAAAGKGKGIALAVLTELGAAKGQEWRFSPADVDIGASVEGPVSILLKGDTERYHESLELASRLSGETVAFAPIG